MQGRDITKTLMFLAIIVLAAALGAVTTILALKESNQGPTASSGSTADPAVTKPGSQEPILTVLTHVDCRTVSAKQDWPVETQRRLGLITGNGRNHEQFVRGYLRFDLSEVDATRPLDSASLFLYCESEPVPETRGRKNRVAVGRLLARIHDSDRRWYNHPVAPTGEQVVPLTKVGLYEIDVTRIVKAWLSGQPNYGFGLRDPGRPCHMNWKKFESGKYDPEQNPNGIRLVIHQRPQ